MKKNYWIIGLCLALAICLAFLLWPDKPIETHNIEHADVVAVHDTLKAHDAISARIIDSLKLREDSILRESKRLLREQGVARRQLDLKTAQLKNTTAEIRDYNKDTGYFGHMLDSLQQQVENLTFLVTQYEQFADSINNVNDSLKINYTAIIIEKDKARAELQAAYDKLYKDYQGLFDTSRVLMKDLKRQKLKTKIAAVLGAVGAVILLLR
jgi:hypothetical protein